MKKIIIFLFGFSLIFLFNNKKQITIPKKSIRYRIVANSNEINDQKLKWDINKELIPILSDITINSISYNESKDTINSNLNNIQNVVNKYTMDNKVVFGSNYFPEKKYNNVIYPEGNYESLAIYLGDAKGDNWWCVLFPPLCLMEAQDNNTNNIDYDLYIKKIINKYS